MAARALVAEGLARIARHVLARRQPFSGLFEGATPSRTKQVQCPRPPGPAAQLAPAGADLPPRDRTARVDAAPRAELVRAPLRATSLMTLGATADGPGPVGTAVLNRIARQLQRSLGGASQELSPRRSDRRIDTLNARPSKGGDEPCGLELPHGLDRLLTRAHNT